ncbi:MAG TPA: GNAT family N-acetyltransferase, partial [Clostridia bacterium]|nr:GNAT family N-acetyltransferase [Clostridia bacterium]
MGIVCVGSCRPFMVLENVIVSQPYRRTGIGRKLMEYIEKYARSVNCNYYIMFVSRANRK